ncbi:hypothetical protein BD412_000763 [Thermoanaerobacterium thermosaccharolyticum]|nr:hypothetical protein [Thermoanaerobacterium thermosaccharolyticum]
MKFMIYKGHKVLVYACIDSQIIVNIGEEVGLCLLY